MSSCFALALGLAVCWSGCGPKELTKIEVPDGGVKLAYDLSPGTAYRGHLRVGNTLQLQGMTTKQTMECDVDLIVTEKAASHSTLRARYVNIDIDMNFTSGPAAGLSLDEALNQIKALEVTLHVQENGKVTHVSPLPAGAPEAIQTLMQQLVDALESAFLVVPERQIKDGEQWTDSVKRGREGKLGRYRVGKTKTVFEGMYRHQRHDTVAKLSVAQEQTDVVTTKEGRRQTERNGKTTAYFSTAGYLAQFDSEIRDFDPTQGMTFRKLQASWRKTSDARKAATQAAPIDPCDPDYVGPDVCEREGVVDDPCDPDYVGPDSCKEIEADPTPSGGQETPESQPAAATGVGTEAGTEPAAPDGPAPDDPG
jgi:hypothetical protein